jgi:hypothetical protein
MLSKRENGIMLLPAPVGVPVTDPASEVELAPKSEQAGGRPLIQQPPSREDRCKLRVIKLSRQARVKLYSL